MKKKLSGKKKIQIIIVSILVLSGIGYIGYGMVVDYMIERMFEQQIEAMLRDGSQVSTSTDQEEIPKLDTIVNDEQGEQGLDEEVSQEINDEIGSQVETSELIEEVGVVEETTATNQEEVPNQNGAIKENELIQEDVATDEEVISQQMKPSESSLPKEEVEQQTNVEELDEEEFEKLVDEKVNEVTSQITTKDKNEMSGLIFSNLSMGQIEYLARLALDGLTGEDLAIAKSIALQSFDDEALEEVEAYYRKYYHLIK